MSNKLRLKQAWLDRVEEDIIDPDREIVDCHHHLWREASSIPYTLPELYRDTGSGHRVQQTVFVECGEAYRTEGPETLRSTGEVEFVAATVEQAANDPDAPSTIAALVSHVDLTLGAEAESIIEQHVAASRGLFRGVRHAGASATKDDGQMLSGNAPEDLFELATFRQGVNLLGRMGHSYESWHYQYQLPDFLALAQSAPDTQIILNHVGTPLTIGSASREALFAQWQKDIAELARCENVTVKLGGLALPIDGFAFMRCELPPSSDEFAQAHRPYILHAIECFGPDRCMFESNFPVDKMVISYPVLWNAYKKIVQDFSNHEQDALFSGTAKRVYRL